jgi:hypothetical protein
MNEHRKMFRVFVAALVTTGWNAEAQVKTGTILQGVISEPNGKKVQNARIVAVLQPSLAKSEFTPWEGFALSSKDGSYSISDVPEGKIEICVDAVVGGFVDPCRWGRPSAVATVAAGAKNVRADVVLTPGKTLRVRLDDEAGFLERHLGKTPGAGLEVGVLNAQRNFNAARLDGVQGNGRRNYFIVVPANTPWRLFVQGSFFSLESENEQARPLSALLSADQDVKDAEGDKEIVIKVRGVKAQAVAQ